MSRNLTGKTATCKSCGYEWLTTSTFIYVSCPRCLNKVRLIYKRQPIIKDDAKQWGLK